MRVCRKCGNEKVESEFSLTTTKSRSGSKSWTYPRPDCRDCVKTRQATAYQKRRPEALVKQRHYYEANPERHDYWRAKNRAKRAGATQFMSEVEWRELRGNKRCHFCRVQLKPSFRTVEHLKPLCEGGQHTIENCVAACSNCNADREWKRKQK